MKRRLKPPEQINQNIFLANLGTAIIGLVLFIALFNVIFVDTGLMDNSGDLTDEEMAVDLQEWVYKMKEVPLPEVLTPEQMFKAEIIVDSAIGSAMKQAMNAISLILILGFILTLFIPEKKKG